MYEHVLNVVGRVYSAAEDRTLWPDALAGMAQLFAVRGVNLMFNDLGNRPDGVMVNHGIDPELVARYNSYYVSIDPIVEASMYSPLGAIFDSEELFSTSWWRRTELHADLMAPYGLEHILGTALLREPSSYGALSMLRPPGAPPLEGELRSAFLLVADHVRRAIEVHRRLAAVERRSDLLADAIDRLAAGVVLLDRHCAVVHANSAAVRLARAADGFAMGRLGVVAGEPGASSALRRLVSGAVATATGARPDGGGAMRLPRPSGRRPLEVLVSPLGDGRYRGSSAVAILFITDPDNAPLPPERLVADLYHLTPAEARLAVALACGSTPEGAAECFGVQISTIRTQLRSVLAKTGARRQSELVGILARGPASLVDWLEANEA